jgi:hypothetical protein
VGDEGQEGKVTVKVRVYDLADRQRGPVEATGFSLAHAVRSAIRLLDLGPGRTISKTEHELGIWLWNWSGHDLEVHDLTKLDRRQWYSTPRSKRTRRGTELTLAPETVTKLAELAANDNTSKSALVDMLVEKEHARRK